MRAICTVSEDYTLVLRAEDRKKLLRLVQPGIEVEAQIDTERPRSLRQHCRYFARLREFAHNIPENAARMFWRNAIDDLATNESIDEEILHELIKRKLGVKSVAFHAMGQDEAAKVYARADELLDRWMARMQGVAE
jgi:hypothetical protein